MNNNNYPTWLVPLYIAKELKEIGFDEPCNHYVRISNDDIKLKINHSSIGWVILKRNSEYLNDYIASFVTIPTWTDVLAWFRKKNLVGLVSYRYRDKNNKGFSFEILDKDADVFLYKTYEQTQPQQLQGSRSGTDNPHQERRAFLISSL